MSPSTEMPVMIHWVGSPDEAKQWVEKVNATEAGGSIKLVFDPSGNFIASGSVAGLVAKLEAVDPKWTEDGRYFIEVDQVRASLPSPPAGSSSLPSPQGGNFSQTFSRNAQTE